MAKLRLQKISVKLRKELWYVHSLRRNSSTMIISIGFSMLFVEIIKNTEMLHCLCRTLKNQKLFKRQALLNNVYQALSNFA